MKGCASGCLSWCIGLVALAVVLLYLSEGKVLSIVAGMALVLAIAFVFGAAWGTLRYLFGGPRPTR